MSSNADVASQPSAAINVGFASVADRYGESSSRGESREESRSSGKRSSHSERREKESKDSTESPDSAKQRGEERWSGNSGGRRVRNSGGFLLESVFANGSPRGGQDHNGKRKAQDGQLRVDKRRPAPARLSAESSLRSSPLSRDVSMEISNASEGGEEPVPRTPSMDPATLVQMALNLSENRKRHVSNTLHVPLPSPRRAASGPAPNIGTVRASSAQNRRSQLSANYDGSAPGTETAGVQDHHTPASGPIDMMQDNVFHTFSPATLARAEKARKYFELASEHRRLLEHLPPLKPDSSAPGNYTLQSVSSPGSAFPEISRVASGANNKHALGRQYNPIQSLRNRRIRIREKRPFTAPPETWQDPENVKAWITEVQSATSDPYYRATADRTHLPTFNGDDGKGTTQIQGATSKHRRTETAGSVITRPENSWTIEPTELLADAYWTEKSDNKSYIESRHGNTIFPSQPRHSVDTPKISVELHRDRPDEMDTRGNDSDDGDDSIRPSRRRRLMLPLKANVDRRKYLRSRSSSRSSGNSTDGGSRRGSTTQRELGVENIGPLERHMQELIAKDANGEWSSPEVTSPDHWGHRNLPFPRRGRDAGLREPTTPANGRASLEVPRETHRRAKSADGRVGSADAAMSSTEDLGSSPASPAIQRLASSMGTDLSQVSTRKSLDSERPRMKLPSFRASSKDRNSIAQVDFADGVPATVLSPILSNDSGRHRSSQDSGRPKQFKRLKTNESSSSNALQKTDSNSTSATFSSVREPGSTVGRFLKGGRDRLKRGDGPRFSDRFKNRDKLDGGLSDASRGVSDISDAEAEDEVKVNGHLKKKLPDAAGYDSDVSPRGSVSGSRPKPKYHLTGLPSFTSAARDKRPQVESRAATSDRLNRQDKAQRDPGKPDRLAPPRISLPAGDNNLPAFRFPAVKFDEPRKSYGDLTASGLTALAVSPFGSISRSPAQRHWSIYDQAQPIKSDKITSRDIARVRALLLCSGIKAREIQRISNLPRETPPKDLVNAAKTAGQKLDRVPYKEEHLVAARMLSTHLTSSLSDFEASLSHFQSDTVGDLASRLDELQHRASDQLTNLVHDTSDEADAFTVELTTRQPQQTKQVDDAIDAMIRRSRRQFRLLRRAGFKLLEWLVLSIMWWIWFLVVVFNTGKRVVMSIFRFLHWLFVF